MAAPVNQALRILNLARNHLTGVVDSVMQYELFAVLDNFLQDTNAWTENVAFAVVPTLKTYGVYPSDGTTIRLQALVDASGNTVGGVMSDLENIVLDTAPSTATVYTATLALTVLDPVATDGYPTMPDWIWIKYGMAFVDGLLGRMMAQPAKPYTSMQLALAHTRAFNSVRGTAMGEVQRGQRMGAQAWSFPRSFR